MKKFWAILKKVLVIQAVMTVVMLFIVTMTSAVRQQKMLVCSSIQVKIDYESGFSFLTTDQVVSRIDAVTDGGPVDKPLSALDFRDIEKGLLADPFIASAKVYVDHARTLHADIIQKQPILRVMNSDGVGFYLSDKNDKMPLCDKFTAHVPVAIGVVEAHNDVARDSTVRVQLFALARYLQHDSLTGALIDHVYVLPDGEMEMYPEFGYHVIEFGRADETMVDKFDKLKIFYKEGLAKVGWEKYKVINLKYTGQIVCQKSANESSDKTEKGKGEPPKEKEEDKDTEETTK